MQEKKKFFDSPLLRDNTPELCSLIIAVLVTIAAVALTFLLPADADTSKYEGVLLTSRIKDCMPEPFEMFRYVLTVALLPTVFLIAYNIFKVRSLRFPSFVNFTVQAVVLLFAAVLFVTAFVATYKTGSLFEHKTTTYFKENFELSLYFILPVTAFLMFFIVASKDNAKSVFHRVLFFSILALVFAYSAYRIITVNYAYQNSPYNLHHYYACWYPIAKVDAGQTIGVDFRSIYGFYPYIAVPILKLFGGANQQSSSILLTVMLVVVAGSYCAFCYRFFKNKILALVVSLVCSVYGPFSLLGDNSKGDKRQYFQYNPLRTFFLGLTLIAIVIRSNLKSKRSILILNIVMTLLGGLAIFWNFESGIICAALWTAYNIYETAIDKKLFSRETLRTALFSALRLAASVGIFVLLVLLITFFRSGQILTLHEVFFGITVFAGTGFNMLPIEFGVWIVLAVIVTLSFVAVLPYLTKHKDCPASLRTNLSGLFAASSAGIGSFLYFVGRSYSTNVLLILPVAMISCGLYAELLLNGESEGFRASSVLRWAKVFLCCVVIAEVLIPSVSIMGNSFSSEFKASHYLSESEKQKLYRDSDTIALWAKKNNGDKLPAILTYFSVLTSEHMNRKPTEIICEQIDWFYIDDAKTYIDYIKAHPDDSFVVDKLAVETLEQDLKKEWRSALKDYTLSYECDDVQFFEKLYFYKPKA